MEAKAGPISRDGIPEEFRWDLTDLYSDETIWKEDFSALKSAAKGYADHQGKLEKSAADLKACLEFDAAISRKLEKLYTFAHLKNDEDKTNTLHQGNFEKVVRLATEISQAASFIRSEIMDIPEDRMEEFLKDKELEFYRFHLEQNLRFRKHTLSEKEESLLASSQEMARAAREGFDMLDNADQKLGSVKDENGSETAITHGNFQSLMQNYDRRVRRETFETY